MRRTTSFESSDLNVLRRNGRQRASSSVIVRTVGGYINAAGCRTPIRTRTTPVRGDQPRRKPLENANYEGDFELGGYVPVHGLRDRLFFFGTFNPSQNHAYSSRRSARAFLRVAPNRSQYHALRLRG